MDTGQFSLSLFDLSVAAVNVLLRSNLKALGAAVGGIFGVPKRAVLMADTFCCGDDAAVLDEIAPVATGVTGFGVGGVKSLGFSLAVVGVTNNGCFVVTVGFGIFNTSDLVCADTPKAGAGFIDAPPNARPVDGLEPNTFDASGFALKENPLEVVGTASKFILLLMLKLTLGWDDVGFSAVIPNDICGFSVPNIGFDNVFIEVTTGVGFDKMAGFSTNSFGFDCNGAFAICGCGCG